MLPIRLFPSLAVALWRLIELEPVPQAAVAGDYAEFEAMPRARNAVAKLRRKRRLLKRAKGYWGGRRNQNRMVQDTLIRAEAYALKHRRKKKGDWRRLWIVRINAACRARGIRYGEFMNALKKANVAMNRKVLADLAVRDPKSFDRLVETYMPAAVAGSEAGQTVS